MPKAPTDSSMPLHGLRVADFCHVYAGPVCTRMLCDLGAEVIKIEPPHGDLSRKLGQRRAGISGYFMQQNCGKLGVSIDLNENAGKELGLRLIEKCDVVVENARPGVMRKLGLGPDEALSVNPRLVYCSISGFGATGPWSGRRAFAGIAHASTGMMHRQAFVYGRRPVDSPMAIGDSVAGLQATVAILAAIRQRDLTGKGQAIDIAMHDALLSIQEAANFYLFSDEGSDTDYLSSWTYMCGEEDVAMPTDPRASWEEMCAVMERPDLVSDERYDSYPKREERLGELEAHIQTWVATQPDAETVVAKLEAAGLPGARVARLSEALECEQTQVREMVVTADDRSGATTRVVNTPYRFSESKAGLRGVPPYRGEDNRMVLTELLSMTEAEIDALERDGIISSRLPEKTSG